MIDEILKEYPNGFSGYADYKRMTNDFPEYEKKYGLPYVAQSPDGIYFAIFDISEPALFINHFAELTPIEVHQGGCGVTTVIDEIKSGKIYVQYSPRSHAKMEITEDDYFYLRTAGADDWRVIFDSDRRDRRVTEINANRIYSDFGKLVDDTEVAMYLNEGEDLKPATDDDMFCYIALSGVEDFEYDGDDITLTLDSPLDDDDEIELIKGYSRVSILDDDCVKLANASADVAGVIECMKWVTPNFRDNGPTTGTYDDEGRLVFKI
ncbi:hypothetical protein [Rhizobium sp. P007]|uniref:hypothetical protein n=1 Tax=Rhizobium sp. P007 TaxID=285908 RepID=UPI00115896F0|nr:hypothetical protein [Rhizobium sp. P007]CAD7041095.1 hypothetical protein RP007_00707 [Rhizobium sp. P007]